MGILLALAIAIATALGNGATALRIPNAADVAPEVFEVPSIIVEYTAPQCPTFSDEPCYVIVDLQTLATQVGP